MSPVERRTAGFSGAIWGLVYLLVSVTGQRFSTAYLGYGWQLVPYEVLRAHPIRSVWYLHIQPPLWNLMIGLTTPPVGVCLFVAANIARLPLSPVIRAITPYIVTNLIMLLMVSYFPPLSTWLPNRLMP